MNWTKTTDGKPTAGETVLMAYRSHDEHDLPTWDYVLGCCRGSDWIDYVGGYEETPDYWARIPSPTEQMI